MTMDCGDCVGAGKECSEGESEMEIGDGDLCAAGGLVEESVMMSGGGDFL